MGFEIFRVKASGDFDESSALNRFLNSRRILTVDRRLVEETGGAYWTFCVEFLDGAKTAGDGKAKSFGKIDYKEILPPEIFEKFNQLRNIRKELAEKEGVPVFAVFTNEQLAEIAKVKPQNLSALKSVEGVGEQKSQRFGPAMLAAFVAPTERTSD